MEMTIQEVEDLVAATVIDLGGDANSVQISGDNILIGDKPVSMVDIMANQYNCRGFVNLIRKAMNIP